MFIETNTKLSDFFDEASYGSNWHHINLVDMYTSQHNYRDISEPIEFHVFYKRTRIYYAVTIFRYSWYEENMYEKSFLEDIYTHMGILKALGLKNKIKIEIADDIGACKTCKNFFILNHYQIYDGKDKSICSRCLDDIEYEKEKARKEQLIAKLKADNFDDDIEEDIDFSKRISEPQQKKYIYVIKAAETNMVKVGIAQNVKSRVRELQTASPFNLEVVKTFKSRDALLHERTIHSELKKAGLHSRGEWFRCDNVNSILGVIDNSISRAA